MKAIIYGGYVIALAAVAIPHATFVETDHGNYAGMNMGLVAIVEAPETARVGNLYKNGIFKQVLTQTEAVGVMTEYMNEFANERYYDDIKSAALRAGYEGPFHAEGIKYATWMDNTWAAGYSILASVESGDIDPPTKEELLAMLPAKPTF